MSSSTTPPTREQSTPIDPVYAAEVNKLSDAQAWSLADSIVLGAATKPWRSERYQHFNISLIRHENRSGERAFKFKFTCKRDPLNHPPQYRARKDTSSGTHNLRLKALACDARAQRVQDAPLSPRLFSPTRFRAITALWCARNHRPFELVEDPLYAMLVDELRPGTKIPDRTTVSHDLAKIYETNAEHIREYFRDVDRIHLAIDGWTAPTSHSYLGLVAVWQKDARIRRTILEFIRLSEKHTGEYLASQTAECLNRYELGQKLFTVCMDNASNNNTFTTELQKRFPTFGGPNSRLRCTAHILNLMAKAFLSVFSKPIKRSRKHHSGSANSTPVAQKRQRIDPKSSNANKNPGPVSVAIMAASQSGEEPHDIDVEDGNESEAEAGELESFILGDNIDEAKIDHDDQVVQEKMDQAFLEFEKQYAIKVSQKDRNDAQQVIPKISRLAKRTHESAYIQQRLEERIKAIPHLAKSKRRTLTRRVATRWNTDLDSILSHVLLRDAVDPLTRDRELRLSQYKLSDDQWILAKQLTIVLRIFEEPTKLFSQAEVPLVHEVIPLLFAVRDQLERVRSDPYSKLKPVLRVAAGAALEVFNKYMGLCADSDIYWVALVMCPNERLQWFETHGYRPEDVVHVKAMAQRQFDQMFGSQTPPPDPASQDAHALGSWASGIDDDDSWIFTNKTKSQSQSGDDTIDAYMADPVISTAQITAAGGLLGYWESQRAVRPQVTQFALSILSAPASSVDAERAFSGGRLTINHLQHSMASQTFKAKMAVGSWYDTPLLPSVDHAADMLLSKRELSL